MKRVEKRRLQGALLHKRQRGQEWKAKSKMKAKRDEDEESSSEYSVSCCGEEDSYIEPSSEEIQQDDLDSESKKDKMVLRHEQNYSPHDEETKSNEEEKEALHHKDFSQFNRFKDGRNVVENLYWENKLDPESPYICFYNNKPWKYIEKNIPGMPEIQKFANMTRRKTFCACLDGCQNPKTCECYKGNKKLQTPTYDKRLGPDEKMIAIQPRAFQTLNSIFSFNECHPLCNCNKDLCLNILIEAENKHRFKFLIKRIEKILLVNKNTQDAVKPVFKSLSEFREDPAPHQTLTPEELEEQNKNFQIEIKKIPMWGLFALEDIPAGAFVIEYTGEIISKKEGDSRGYQYDKLGMSYLFDMNDPDEGSKLEMDMQKAYNNDFFPLCIDAGYYGNEARFINHSCQPNLKSYNLVVDTETSTYHHIGFFASHFIKKGEELTLDYHWDKNELDIEKSVPCLCGSQRCRRYLMKAKKQKKGSSSGGQSLQSSEENFSQVPQTEKRFKKKVFIRPSQLELES